MTGPWKQQLLRASQRSYIEWRLLSANIFKTSAYPFLGREGVLRSVGGAWIVICECLTVMRRVAVGYDRGLWALKSLPYIYQFRMFTLNHSVWKKLACGNVHFDKLPPTNPSMCYIKGDN